MAYHPSFKMHELGYMIDWSLDGVYIAVGRPDRDMTEDDLDVVRNLYPPARRDRVKLDPRGFITIW
jgi:hypothetical protein